MGYDSGKQQKIAAIRDGMMAGAITQNPIGIGYKSVESAVKALKGEKLAQAHRHRVLLVRQDQHQRSEDCRCSLRLNVMRGDGGVVRLRLDAEPRAAPHWNLPLTSITGMQVLDLRFPTSQPLDGSDAMNPAPDYSAAYVILETDAPRPRRPRADLHHRPRQRDLLRGDGGAAPSRRR